MEEAADEAAFLGEGGPGGRGVTRTAERTLHTFQITADNIAGPGAGTPASITATPGPTS
ncbi:MAG TPA: hypothetical protein VFU73_06965 [Actinocrinis sp.]|nr:hypothetical protein [Actinocrinis sp.]